MEDLNSLNIYTEEELEGYEEFDLEF